MEGVLTPEIWIEFSQRTGIAEFRRTTRDEPDYDKLMRYRIALLAEHGLKLADIQAVIDSMGPLPGAKDFLDDLRARYQVIILSDTFYEFADPLMRKLGRPTLFCHRLVVDDTDVVRDYRLRQGEQKRQAVNALKSLNFQVIAAGDSYNDTGMLAAADAGVFINPPETIAAQFPQFPVTRSYAELTDAIDTAAARLSKGKGGRGLAPAAALPSEPGHAGRSALLVEEAPGGCVDSTTLLPDATVAIALVASTAQPLARSVAPTPTTAAGPAHPDG
jgi:phosphoserine/homoserine phosphotransferase